MSADRVMVIRHGEKPNEAGAPPVSVMAPGDTGRNDLSPRGWQRAGALVRFFAPRGGDHAERPAALFAARADARFPSLRTQQTLEPLAAFLGGRDPAAGTGTPMPVTTPSAPDEVDTAARAILGGPDPVLVCWEHKNIARLVAAVTGDGELAPHWSGDRFDVVLVLERAKQAWRLTQLPQMLLAGDSRTPLRARRPGEDR